MYTLCISDGFEGSLKLVELLQKIDPAGTHRIIEEKEEGALEKILSERPDAVWLAANEKGLELAGEGHRKAPETNYIFTAKGPELAYQAMKARASGYLLEPVTEDAVREELDNLRSPAGSNRSLLRVQCFGSFEAFSSGVVVKFSRSLSKEALAYMVDRRGAGCTVAEICSILWESRPVDTGLKSQCRVILASLKKDLEAVGAGAVLVKNWNNWCVDVDKIDCDYYDFLRGDAKDNSTYCGEYMAQYSWAERTGGGLYQMANG